MVMSGHGGFISTGRLADWPTGRQRVFFDLWSLFENREQVMQILQEGVVDVFLTTSLLGTDPILLTLYERDNPAHFTMWAYGNALFMVGWLNYFTDESCTELNGISIYDSTSSFSISRIVEAGSQPNFVNSYQRAGEGMTFSCPTSMSY